MTVFIKIQLRLRAPWTKSDHPWQTGPFLSKGKMRTPKGWNKQSELYTCKHPSCTSLWQQKWKTLILWCLSLKSSPLTARHLTIATCLSLLQEGIHSRTVPQVLFGVQLQDQSWLGTMAGRRAAFQGSGKLHHTIWQPASAHPTASSRAFTAQQHQHYNGASRTSLFSCANRKRIKPLSEGRTHRKAGETTGTADTEAVAVIKTKAK